MVRTKFEGGGRFYVGEVLDVYKKGASNRYGSLDFVDSVAGLAYLSLRGLPAHHPGKSISSCTIIHTESILYCSRNKAASLTKTRIVRTKATWMPPFLLSHVGTAVLFCAPMRKQTIHYTTLGDSTYSVLKAT